MRWLTLSVEATISVSGSSDQPIYRKKMREYWLKYEAGSFWYCDENHFLNVMFHNTEMTETCHGNAPQVLFVARTTMAKSLTEAGFVFLLHKRVLNVSLADWCARIRLNVRISSLEKESATGSKLLSAWGAKSIQWNIKMPRLHLVADVINRCEELIQSWPIRQINANNIGNGLDLQRSVSVVKFIAERRLAFGDDENVGSPRTSVQNFLKLFQANILKKRGCDASNDWFCNSFTNR